MLVLLVARVRSNLRELAAAEQAPAFLSSSRSAM
jgi:hypothetical protein